MLKRFLQIESLSLCFTGFGSSNTGSVFGQAASSGGSVFGQVSVHDCLYWCEHLSSFFPM